MTTTTTQLKYACKDNSYIASTGVLEQSIEQYSVSYKMHSVIINSTQLCQQ